MNLRAASSGLPKYRVGIIGHPGAGHCLGYVSDAQRMLGQSKAPAKPAASLELGARGAQRPWVTLQEQVHVLPRNPETPHLRGQHSRDRCTSGSPVSSGEMWTEPSHPLCARSWGCERGEYKGGTGLWLLALSHVRSAPGCGDPAPAAVTCGIRVPFTPAGVPKAVSFQHTCFLSYLPGANERDSQAGPGHFPQAQLAP